MQHIWVYDIMINWYWFSDQKQTIQFEKPRISFETSDLEIILKGWTFSAHTDRTLYQMNHAKSDLLPKSSLETTKK